MSPPLVLTFVWVLTAQLLYLPSISPLSELAMKILTSPFVTPFVQLLLNLEACKCKQLTST